MTRAFDIGGSPTDVAGNFAGNILRLSLRDQRWAIQWNDRSARSAPGRIGEFKREKPRPWQVRGSRAEMSPRFWLIVMSHRTAACVLRATASSLKPR